MIDIQYRKEYVSVFLTELKDFTSYKNDITNIFVKEYDLYKENSFEIFESKILKRIENKNFRGYKEDVRLLIKTYFDLINTFKKGNLQEIKGGKFVFERILRNNLSLNTVQKFNNDCLFINSETSLMYQKVHFKIIMFAGYNYLLVNNKDKLYYYYLFNTSLFDIEKYVFDVVDKFSKNLGSSDYLLYCIYAHLCILERKLDLTDIFDTK